MTTSSVRVRFAPSPTGPLHMGGVRTALYNYLFAKKMGGIFLLRIEDTDQNRYVEGAEDYIMEALKWCGMALAEGPEQGGPYGPYRQSERKHLYKQYADQLVEAGHAYYAFDTPEELDAMRERLKSEGSSVLQYNHATRTSMKNSLTLSNDEVKQLLEDGVPHVIRIKIPRNEEVKFNDIIRGWVTFNSSQLDDKVIYKADGMPTYHLANVVDDHLMQISHVIRGEEWLPSTPTHVYLYRFLGWEESMPQFAHLPLILKPDGKGKLSKRDGDRLGFPVFPLDWTDSKTGEQSTGYRERGFLPEAFINMLAFLGWNPGTEEELFEGQALIDAFSLERIGHSGAHFDFEKAKWFNQQYIKQMDADQLSQAVSHELQLHHVEKDDAFIAAYAKLFQERVTFIKDYYEQGYYLFEDIKTYDPKVVRKKWKPERRPVFEQLFSTLQDLEPWNVEHLEPAIKGVMEDAGLGFGDIFQPLRVMISGQAGGPSIFDLMELMGKDLVLERMQKGFATFDEMKAASQ